MQLSAFVCGELPFERFFFDLSRFRLYLFYLSHAVWYQCGISVVYSVYICSVTDESTYKNSSPRPRPPLILVSPMHSFVSLHNSFIFGLCLHTVVEKQSVTET